MLGPSRMLFLMLSGNLFETLIINIERRLRSLCFGATFDKVPIIMANVAFERSPFII